MAFQPILDCKTKSVFAYEALVRGEFGEGASEVFERVNAENVYTFDQVCRIAAIRTIASLDKSTVVSINFLPNAIYEPETCLARTVETMQSCHYPFENVIFEVTEHEKIENHDLLCDVFQTYREKGFRTAIDDFGEGFAGLNLLAEFQTHFIKLDIRLIQGIHDNKVKQSILAGIQITCQQLGIELIAEGVEDIQDYRYLLANHIRYMQGFLFAKPELEALPEINWSKLD